MAGHWIPDSASPQVACLYNLTYQMGIITVSPSKGGYEDYMR